MNASDKFSLITRHTEEILTSEDLHLLLEKNTPLKHYIGFEISGFLHIGSGLMSALKIKDFLEAGVDCTIFLADWHTWLNDKLGGNLETIQRVAVGYFKEALTASLLCVGADPVKIKFLLGSDLYHHNDEYWQNLIKICKNLTLARVVKSSTIMGRQEGENQIFARLIYPPMQVNDIYIQGVNLAHAGLDQRKAHVIAREVAKNLGLNPPVAIHHHLILGLGKPREWPVKKEELREIWSDLKMSKSQPNSAVFIHDSPDEIRRKILDAFCPEKEIEFNPPLDWAKHLVFREQEYAFKIKRDNRYGGDIVFNVYGELENAFAQGQLHPLDLKNAVAEEIINLLEPARKHFAKEQNQKTFQEMKEIIKSY